MLRDIYIVQEDAESFAARCNYPDGEHLTDGYTLEDVISKALPFAEHHGIDFIKVDVGSIKVA